MPGMPLRPCALRTASQLLAAKSLLLCSLAPAHRPTADSSPLLQEPTGLRSEPRLGPLDQSLCSNFANPLPAICVRSLFSFENMVGVSHRSLDDFAPN